MKTKRKVGSRVESEVAGLEPPAGAKSRRNATVKIHKDQQLRILLLIRKFYPNSNLKLIFLIILVFYTIFL